MKKCKDTELQGMAEEAIRQHYEQLLGRKDFDKYEGYGERLLYWLEVKRWARTAANVSGETN